MVWSRHVDCGERRKQKVDTEDKILKEILSPFSLAIFFLAYYFFPLYLDAWKNLLVI